MKKYFIYSLKKNFLILACFTLFCVIMYVVPIATHNYTMWNDSIPTFDNFVRLPNLYYSNISVALGIMSVLIPLFMFSYKMNKRSVDMFYSLPISKKKILAVNFLVGLILMYASYSIAFLWGFITVALKVKRLYLIYYLYLYLASLIPAFITYSFASFIFTRANTFVDGIVSLVGAIFIVVTFVLTLTELADPMKWTTYTDCFLFFPFVPLEEATTAFGSAVISGNVAMWFDSSASWKYQSQSDLCTLISCIMWTLISIAMTIALIITENRSKAENCGQISQSAFCYKIQIPAYTVMLLATAVAGSANFTALCAIIFGAFVMCIIYMRTIKIGWKYTIIMISCAVLGIILGAIAKAIR